MSTLVNKMVDVPLQLNILILYFSIVIEILLYNIPFFVCVNFDYNAREKLDLDRGNGGVHVQFQISVGMLVHSLFSQSRWTLVW